MELLTKDGVRLALFSRPPGALSAEALVDAFVRIRDAHRDEPRARANALRAWLKSMHDAKRVFSLALFDGSNRVFAAWTPRSAPMSFGHARDGSAVVVAARVGARTLVGPDVLHTGLTLAHMPAGRFVYGNGYLKPFEFTDMWASAEANRAGAGARARRDRSPAAAGASPDAPPADDHAPLSMEEKNKWRWERTGSRAEQASSWIRKKETPRPSPPRHPPRASRRVDEDEGVVAAAVPGGARLRGARAAKKARTESLAADLAADLATAAARRLDFAVGAVAHFAFRGGLARVNRSRRSRRKRFLTLLLLRVTLAPETVRARGGGGGGGAPGARRAALGEPSRALAVSSEGTDRGASRRMPIRTSARRAAAPRSKRASSRLRKADARRPERAPQRRRSGARPSPRACAGWRGARTPPWWYATSRRACAASATSANRVTTAATAETRARETVCYSSVKSCKSPVFRENRRTYHDFQRVARCRVRSVASIPRTRTSQSPHGARRAGVRRRWAMLAVAAPVRWVAVAGTRHRKREGRRVAGASRRRVPRARASSCSHEPALREHRECRRSDAPEVGPSPRGPGTETGAWRRVLGTAVVAAAFSAGARAPEAFAAPATSSPVGPHRPPRRTRRASSAARCWRARPRSHVSARSARALNREPRARGAVPPRARVAAHGVVRRVWIAGNATFFQQQFDLARAKFLANWVATRSSPWSRDLNWLTNALAVKMIFSPGRPSAWT